MKKWIVSACLLMMQAGAWGKISRLEHGARLHCPTL